MYAVPSGNVALVKKISTDVADDVAARDQVIGSCIDLFGLDHSTHDRLCRKSRFCAAVGETREEMIDKDGIMTKDLEMAIQKKHYYHWEAINGYVDAVNVKRNPFQAT